MKKLIFSLLFLISFSYGFEIDYGILKLKILSFYPVKSYMYEREPIFIRFDIKVLKNKTGIKKEILLKNINLKPSDPKIILFQQEKSIHLEEKKLTVKNTLYMKHGDTYFPFIISFDTDRLKGILTEEFLKKLSKKIMIKKKQPVYISPVPQNIPYVGDFDIKTYLEDSEGVATLYIKITGKGYPETPEYSLIVKNGSAKKIGSLIENKMGFITSVQKYKIVYMDELEVLPVKLRYFDPYTEKVIEKETKTIKIALPEKEKKITVQELPEEERIKFYIENFRKLYPEYFQKKSLSMIVVNYLYTYKNHILGIVLLMLIITVFYTRKILVNKIPDEIKEIIEIPEENLSSIKRLYRYFSRENIPQYYRVIDALIYKADIYRKNNKIIKIRSPEREYSPEEVVYIIQNLKKLLISKKLDKYPEKIRKTVKIWLFINKNFYGLLIFSLVLALTLFIQLFIDRYPDLKTYLSIVNFVIVLAGIISYLITKRPVLKDGND